MPVDLDTPPTFERPTLTRDPSFFGAVATQFLGAFNDNLYKQLVLLICVGALADERGGKGDLQAIAMAMFAAPFVLFSGFAGVIADAVSKSAFIIFCKVLELIVMVMGALAFALFGAGWLGGPDAILPKVPLFMVLFLMGLHSTLFGPCKYGVLPELFRPSDLPRVNGLIQMTTFLAIILGTAAPGLLLWATDGRLWVGSLACLAVAGLGIWTATLMRYCEPARAAWARATWSDWFISRETRELLRHDRRLFNALAVIALFWLAGGVVQPAVNALGEKQLGVDLPATSFLSASVALGIAVGCVMAGLSSRARVDFRMMRRGAWGMVVMLLAISAAPRFVGVPNAGDPTAWYWLLLAAMVLLGTATGLFIVPLQVFLQHRAPPEQRGRVIAAMNLFNWIGILSSAGVYGISAVVRERLDLAPSIAFAVAAIILAPIPIFYHPISVALSDQEGHASLAR